MNYARIVSLMVAVTALLGAALFVGFVNYDNLVGAFGDGPPFYGRTTNMDKWRNPIPYLIALDVVTVAALFWGGRWVGRKIQRRGRET
jgi:hypothetical protein